MKTRQERDQAKCSGVFGLLFLAGSSNEPGGFLVVLRSGGAGGLRRDLESTGRHFPNQKIYQSGRVNNRLTQEAQQDLVVS